ncbi:MAG TPA: hypothetical protein PLJ60_05130 [Chryseolinea sp.]|nr:hypothetical protein [Chryseolinea sp.]HPM29702.1 hypothetical protein [Chryseolinea sp.]
MKSKLSVLFILVGLSCTSPKNDETSSSDSTQTISDTLIIDEVVNEMPQRELPISNEPLPFDGLTDNFPNFSLEALTEDSLEAEINTQLIELIQAYDTIQYFKVISNYTWERERLYQGQEGEGSMGTETESETKTWFFDKSFQLKAFSAEFNTEPVYPFTKTILYLFSNDSMLAVSEYWLSEDEVTVTGYDRMIRARCPACGVSSQAGHRENGEVKYLDSTAFVTRQKEFNESMSELLKTLKAGRKNATADDFDFTFTIQRTKEGNAQENSKTIKYPVTFTVSKELYPNYILK